VLKENDDKNGEELAVYLTESFGNSVRIDYGTGHELNFVIFLMCLFKIEILNENDTKAAVLKIFNRFEISCFFLIEAEFSNTSLFRYLELVRKLQKTYNMEPAGSHGVWSLDDFQFLPFIFGSSQLIG
jgi:serine/threonine-protein phosphatase 2A activator